MANETAPLLSCEGLSYGFSPGQMFLHDVTLGAVAGQLCTIIGPNGAGKSTLVRLLVGLLPPASGRVTLCGQSVRSMSARDRARIAAYLPQNPAPPQGLTVEEVVRLGRYPHRAFRLFESAEDLKAVERAMELTGTLGFASRRMDTLSGGEAQRVHLAAALAQSPRVLVLDEPTSDLDLYHQLETFGLLRDLARRLEMAVVAVTHDLNLASQHADVVALLDRGRVVCAGSPEEVLRIERLEEVYRVRFSVVDGPDGQRPWLASSRVEEGARPMSWQR